MGTKRRTVTVAILMAVMALTAATLQAAPSAPQVPVRSNFTFQGRLEDGTGPVTDDCDFKFSLWDAPSGGSQLGTNEMLAAVPVTDGYFTVYLNNNDLFGTAPFQGAARYLDISVRCPTETGSYALLGRQPLTAAPYAFYGLAAPWSGLSGMPAGFADGIDDDTTYSAGTGLDLNAEVFRIANAYRLPTGCANGGIAEYKESTGTWVCGVDDSGAGGSFWSLGGNLGTDPATHYLGTGDAVTLTLRVDGTPALRLAPSPGAPNLIGGSEYNAVTDGAKGAVIGGGGETGQRNLLSDNWGTVSGGKENQAGDDDGDPTTAPAATVGGGYNNRATANQATVAGGGLNQASGEYATVGGGAGNVASGDCAMIPGGTANAASGDYSFAAGRAAQANHDGCFVWGDSTSFPVDCSAANRFVAQAGGGVDFYTSSDLSTGAYLAAGSGTWSSLSDRALKENLAPVDAEATLRAVAALPITTWNYKGEEAGVQHMGPMAQDFYAAFGLGDSERHITTIDADGVALAAIQGLHAQNQALAAENAALQAQVDTLEAQNAGFEARLAALEAGSPAPARSSGSGSLLWAGGLLVAVAGVWSLGRQRLGGGGR